MLEIIYQDDWLVAVNKPSGWLVHRSWLDRDEKVVVMQTVRDQIGQHVFTAHRLDRPTSGVLLMGLSSEAGRLLAQQFEQHQIRKRYHAIVRGWLMEEALLDYPLVEELDRIADKFAREDKGPQPAVTHYRVWRQWRCRSRPGAIPPRAMGWWNWSRKPAASTSCAVIWPTSVIRSSATASTAICGKPQRRGTFRLSPPDAARQRAVVNPSFYRRAADPARRF